LIDDPAASAANIEVVPIASDIRRHLVAMFVAREETVGYGSIAANALQLGIASLRFRLVVFMQVVHKANVHPRLHLGNYSSLRFASGGVRLIV